MYFYLQAFFDEQLRKHDTACSLIQANLDAQDKILGLVEYVACLAYRLLDNIILTCIVYVCSTVL